MVVEDSVALGQDFLRLLVFSPASIFLLALHTRPLIYHQRIRLYS
jgi:hypothetical protein